ncbi:MAG: 50S ribosomal protein L25 [Clostridiales bacterium]|mgnify:CR=1 FL=1|nr:50S ribosomal protein L25 [Clostridiales bacterium]
MSKVAELNVDIRKEISKRENRRLINNGYAIGIITRKGDTSVPIAVRKDELRRVIRKHGRNAILKLHASDSSSYDVMIKKIEYSPLKYDYYHIDFQKVSLNEEIKVDVAIRFTGKEFLESKRLVLNRVMDEIPLIGLPQNIPEFIEVDVSNREDGDVIYVKDLVLGEGLKTDADEDQQVASITVAKIVETETEESGEEVVVSEVELKAGTDK